MREKCVAAAAAMFWLANLCWSNGGGSLRGELTCDACNLYADYVIELSDLGGTRPVERTMLRGAGDFDFHNIPEGNYSISVTLAGRVLKTDIIHVRGHGNFITIRLPKSNEPTPPAGVVSITRLKHKVPKEARKEYRKAEDRMAKGDLDGSLAHLRRATEIDPEYIEALNNLGCRYLMKKQPMEAVAQFRRALEIDRHARLIHSNMALALISAGQMKESENYAREALSIDPADDKGGYVLAMSLYSQQKYTDEAVQLLRKASDVFPKARLALAATLANRGDREAAKAVLNRHLTSEQVVDRPTAEAMLLSLR